MPIPRKYSVPFRFAILLVPGYFLLEGGLVEDVSFTRLFSEEGRSLVWAATCAFVASVALSAWRLSLLLNAVSVRVNWFEAFRLTLMGSFFNLVLPGVIGGDVAKGVYLTKHETTAKGASSGVVFLDRVVGLLALIVVGCGSVIVLLQQQMDRIVPYREPLLLVLSGASFLVAMALAFLLLTRNRDLRSRTAEFIRSMLGRGFFFNMIASVALLSDRYRVLTLTFVISIGIQVLGLIGICSLAGVGADMDPGTMLSLMAVSSVVLLLGVVPVTPGNLGWTELMASHGWSAVGSSEGAEVFLYWRVITLLCSIPGGLIYLFANPGRQA